MTTSPHDHAPQAHEMHSHGSGHGPGRVSWAMAATATLHCLTGCAIGEVLGMVIGTSIGLPTGPRWRSRSPWPSSSATR